MKKLILLVLTLTLGVGLYAQAPLAPDQPAPLYAHLYEVNKAWAKQAERELLPLQLVSFRSDIERIQAHLRWVEGLLRLRAIDDLPEGSQSARLAQLDMLQAYWREGTFPVNLYHRARQPYFVDHLNTACAVGHLMRTSGAETVVERIQTAHNYAYIEELADDQDLLAWAQQHGFQVDELAWIQPGYNPITHTARELGNNLGVAGQIHVMQAQENLLYIGGDFTAVDGVSAQGVVAWDGEEWITFPGLEGEVRDLSPGYPLGTRFYVTGSFQLAGYSEPVHIAEWYEGEWHPLQVGDMQGDIYTLQRFGAELLIGGDFQQVDGINFSHLALYNLNTQSWSNKGGNLVTNGPVYDAVVANGRLLLGGDFTQVGTENTTVTSLAYFDVYADEWLAPPPSEQEVVRHIAFHDGLVYTASDMDDLHPFAGLSGGLWYYQDYFYGFAQPEFAFYGFLSELGKEPLLFGDYVYGNFVSTYGIGQVYQPGDFSGLVTMDAAVRAAAYYQDQLVIAGDFQTVAGKDIQQIGIVELVTDVIEPDSPQALARVYTYANTLHINDLQPSSSAQIDIFDTNGRLLQRAQLEPLLETQSVSLPQVSAGMYVYRLRTEKGVQAGQLVLLR